MRARVARTLGFAAMRENIAECVDRVDAQTFGPADRRPFGPPS
ncbi:hypothetical protein [Halobaculum gomorrense]|uniref:Uncharacterized protein n=1 Tax=Halobaculum gomorrense TaxID=43928 RepID=A0A1M5RKA8_9EURY|nr:hypothetical protein [Halobaculum gomorrense]SHH26579.1 hypothetical protein SAMN05443636_2225 [Halobaculum gomorrense]